MTNKVKLKCVYDVQHHFVVRYICIMQIIIQIMKIIREGKRDYEGDNSHTRNTADTTNLKGSPCTVVNLFSM